MPRGREANKAMMNQINSRATIFPIFLN